MLIGAIFALAASAATLSDDATVEKALKAFARTVKPTKMGPLEAVNATASGRKLTINMKSDPSSDIGELRKQWHNENWSMLCNSVQLRQAMVSYQVTVAVSWSQPDGQSPLVADMNAERCAALDQTIRASNESRQGDLSNRFEFKGIHTGDTAPMHVEKWGTIIRNSSPCGIGRVYIPLNSCSFRDSSISGINFAMSASFQINGSLVQISGLTEPAGFELVYEAFKLKYGQPASVENPTYQNAFGQERQFPRAMWVFSDGNLLLYHDPDRGGKYMRFRFRTNEYQAFIDSKTPKPKVDF